MGVAYRSSARALAAGVGVVLSLLSPPLARALTLRVPVEVPEPRIVPAPESPGFHRLEVDGWDTAPQPGQPAALPVRVVVVAVPPAGAVRVRALPEVPVVREGVTLAAAPGVSAAPPRAAESAAVELIEVGWLRDQRVARIAVRPFRLEGARLSWSPRIDLEVDVVGEAPAPLVSPALPDRFEDAYREIANYEQGRAWRRSRGANRTLAGGLAAATPAEVLLDTNSVFVGRPWAKIAITRTGFYKVNFGDLRNRTPFTGRTDTPHDSLRLFAWPGLPLLAEDSYCDTCDYREVAIAFVDDDAVFDDNADALYFYALGPSDWANVYDPAAPDTTFINHPYETKSYYYLTVSTEEHPVPGVRKRIASDTTPFTPGGGETTLMDFRERLHFEQDVEYFPNATPRATPGSTFAWEKWFWRSLDLGRSYTPVADLPGVQTSAPATLRMRLWGLEADTCNRPFVNPDHLVNVRFNGQDLGNHGWREPQRRTFRSGYTVEAALTALQETGNAVRLEVVPQPACAGRLDRVGLAWFDVAYQRRFVPAGERLSFTSPGGGNYIHRIEPFAGATPPRVFDVTDPLAPVEHLELDYTPTTGGWSLAFETQETGARRYAVLPDTAIGRVGAADVVSALPTSLVNLRSTARRADQVIVFYDGFAAAAESLATWRREVNGLDVVTVPISALYDQFSGGRTDPAAIRNFLRVAWLNWARPEPTYVTFLGDASYDFKNISGRAPAGQPGSLLPSYEGGYDPAVQHQFASDDWILNVDDAAVVIPDFLGGRLPVGDAATAMDVVRNKVLLYERAAPYGEYRNQVMLIADDDRQGAIADRLRWTHLAQTSVLDSVDMPRFLDRIYVYLHTYPTGPGFTKPEAKADLRARVNAGVLLFNYIGHGSPFKITDEEILLHTDVGTLVNTDRLPIFVAASCDVGKYNDPAITSLGERLITHPRGGAIGVVSATDEAFSGQNASLNRILFQRLFARDVQGRFRTTISGALLAAKVGSVNNQKYQLLGDAATVPNLPVLTAELSLWDSAGTTPVSSLERGRTLTLRGNILDRPGGPAVAIDGVASLLIEDSAPLNTSPVCFGCDPTTAVLARYYHTAGPIFRGDVSVQGGTFSSRFVVPLDARTGARGRLRAYLQGVHRVHPDGVGSATVGVVPGTPSASDQAGPSIGLSFTTGATSVRRDAVLRIDLFDPSGILITGHTARNGIVVTVDGNTTNRVDVTSSFRYAADSYTSGRALFQLPDLAPGPHQIEVSAADNLAAGLTAGSHRSTATIDFEVVDLPPLRLTRAYLFPNPIRSGGAESGGTFVIDAPGDSVNALIKIYTVAGKLIRTLQSFGGLAQVQIPWDGLDAEGALLANGTYLFTVHVNARDEEGESSPFQKAQSRGRFVVVNR